MGYVSLQHKKHQRTLLRMMLPGFAVMCVIFIYPIGKLLFNSLEYYKLIDTGNIHFIGFENYFDAFRDTRFIQALITTLRYVLYALMIEVPLALVLMEIISTTKRGVGLIKTSFLPSMIMPAVIAGTIWRLMLNPSFGIVTWIMSAFGVNATTWLTSRATALQCVVLVDIWSATPFLLIIFLAGRTSISEELYESAKIDGTGKIRTFFSITLPLMHNTLIFGLMIRLTDCIRVFPTIHIMTAGGPGTTTQTLNYYIYRTAFSYSNIGYGSAMGIIMLLISIALVILLVNLFNVGKRGEITA